MFPVQASDNAYSLCITVSDYDRTSALGQFPGTPGKKSSELRKEIARSMPCSKIQKKYLYSNKNRSLVNQRDSSTSWLGISIDSELKRSQITRTRKANVFGSTENATSRRTQVFALHKNIHDEPFNAPYLTQLATLHRNMTKKSDGGILVLSN